MERIEMAEYQYDAFISYRHVEHDKAVAKKLHTLIETYHIPGSVAAVCGKKKMGKVFRDEEELPLAVSLSENIETALRASEWLIVICSPDYLTSAWCMKEIDYFISLGRRDHILLVLASGTPETSFPPQLTKVETEEGEKSIEPLAANIASENTSESLKRLGAEKLRLLAPMLGVGYDDLRRRARQRRIRITAAVAAAVVVLGAASGLYVSSQNRKKAELQIGELIEKAESNLQENERIFAAQQLLEADSLSSKAGRYRSGEIEEALRRTVYIEPFTKIAGFSGQSIRVLDPVTTGDGTFVLGIVNNNSIARLDLLKGSIDYEVSVSNSDISDLSISQDGKRFLAICDRGRTAEVWDTADGKHVLTYQSKANQEFHVANAFFLGSDTILVQDMDKFYKVSADGSETLIYTLGDYRGTYDPDNNFLTWLAGKSISSLITLHTDDYSGMSVAVSPDASKILICGKDGSTGVVIIDSDGKPICEVEGMPGVFSDKWCFTPDGKYVVCTSYFTYFGVWDAQTGKKLYAYTTGSGYGLANFSNVVFTPESKRMAFVADYYLYVIDIEGSRLLFGGTLEDTNISPMLAYSPDGSVLFVRDRDLLAVDVDNKRVLAALPAEFSSAYNSSLPVLGGKGLFVMKNDGTAAILSMPGLASVSTSDTFGGELATDIDKGYSFSGGTLQSEHTISEGYKTSAADKNFEPGLYVSDDGKYAVLSHADGVLEIFDEKDKGKVTRKISEYQSRVSDLSIYGGILVCCNYQGKLLAYDIDAGSIIKIWNTGVSSYDIIMSPSGKHFMVMYSSLEQIDVYSCEKGFLFSMTDSEGFLDMAFTKDGSRAVGKAASGYVAGEMFTDASELRSRAELLAGK